MKFPSGERYNEAVQNTQVYFSDPAITQGRVQTDAMGLPDVLSGGFAFTYKFRGPSGDMAVRCFHREIPDLFERYRAISAFLNSIKSRFFVDFVFSEKGIKVEGAFLPVVRMQWVEGETLLGYVDRHRFQPNSLANLRTQVLAFADEADSYGYAHGDVQHRNLMVTATGALRLVDYDGMYVPALKHLKAADGGQPNFQPPSRSARDYGPRMDRFPLAVIDFSLEALQAMPKLFDEFHQGENLILSQRDFTNPGASPILNRIARLPGMTAKVAAFSRLCRLAVNEMPKLRDFRANQSKDFFDIFDRPAQVEPRSQSYQSTFVVVDGMNFSSATGHVGSQVELVGRVMSTKALPSGDLLSMRFGMRYTDTPAVVIPLSIFRAWSGSTKLEAQPWISARGVLQQHRSGRHSTIQVMVKDTSYLELLVSKEEADFRLGRIMRSVSVAAPRSPHPPTPAQSVSTEKHWRITRSNPNSNATWIDDQVRSRSQNQVAGQAVPAPARTSTNPASVKNTASSVPLAASVKQQPSAEQPWVANAIPPIVVGAPLSIPSSTPPQSKNLFSILAKLIWR
jgi:hypothetical protein